MNEASLSPALDGRLEQAFPELSAADIARVRRFGTPHRYPAGTRIFERGKTHAGLLVVLSGTVAVTAQDGHGHEVPVVEHGPAHFAGELGSLTGRRAMVDIVAMDEVEALAVDPAQLRALLVAEASLGERIMRALILRRVGLIDRGLGGPVLIGGASSPGVARLRSFLSRNGIPHLLLDPAEDADARAFVERYAPAPGELPLAVCPDGSVLRNPADDALAKCIGMVDSEAIEQVFDVAIVGAGPAGLAAAVYAASEGLSVIVVDARAFGARMLIPASVASLHCEVEPGEPIELRLTDGRAVRCRAVVIATGARYRRPECANLRDLEGHGVWYWASPIEARMCAGEEVALVGGGNSAGQAAVFLSGHAAKVWMLVRGEGLAASMSRYLIDRIAATPAIELLTRTEIVGLSGTRETGLESVTWRNRDTRHEDTRPIRNVFMFLGADPETAWLEGCDVAIDEKGFVKTGLDARLPLATNVPGVFAIGDVRSGSVKRVGGAIGEGANVVAQIHGYLQPA